MAGNNLLACLRVSNQRRNRYIAHQVRESNRSPVLLLHEGDGALNEVMGISGH